MRFRINEGLEKGLDEIEIERDKGIRKKRKERRSIIEMIERWIVERNKLVDIVEGKSLIL